MQKLEAAGAGGSEATHRQIRSRQWLGPRRELAIEVETMCEPVRTAGDGQLGATRPKARVCTASAQLPRFTGIRRGQGDGKTYKSGDK